MLSRFMCSILLKLVGESGLSFGCHYFLTIAFPCFFQTHGMLLVLKIISCKSVLSLAQLVHFLYHWIVQFGPLKYTRLIVRVLACLLHWHQKILIHSWNVYFCWLSHDFFIKKGYLPGFIKKASHTASWRKLESQQDSTNNWNSQQPSITPTTENKASRTRHQLPKINKPEPTWPTCGSSPPSRTVAGPPTPSYHLRRWLSTFFME